MCLKFTTQISIHGPDQASFIVTCHCYDPLHPHLSLLLLTYNFPFMGEGVGGSRKGRNQVGKEKLNQIQKIEKRKERAEGKERRKTERKKRERESSGEREREKSLN